MRIWILDGFKVSPWEDIEKGLLGAAIFNAEDAALRILAFPLYGKVLSVSERVGSVEDLIEFASSSEVYISDDVLRHHIGYLKVYPELGKSEIFRLPSREIAKQPSDIWLAFKELRLKHLGSPSKLMCWYREVIETTC